ncbi:MAG: hypothetical protein MUF20_06515 [Methylotetracoccus sp.]|nr:hypothetical protein [Methylotetracoccus sp.]
MAEEATDVPVWEAGFEGDRALVVARLAFFQRVFPKPPRYRKRFHHQVIELGIEDWSLPVTRRELVPGCTIDISVKLRFQPTVRYARQHTEYLPNLGVHIRESYLTLLLDAVEEELRALENPRWLNEGCDTIERAVETAIHELLALRDIQSRAYCSLQPDLQGLSATAPDAGSANPRYRALSAELLRRQALLAEELDRQRHEQERQERETLMAIEEARLELVEREERIRRRQEELELERLRAQLEAEEMRQAEQRLSDARIREEQIRQEARLRDLELDIDRQEQDRRAQVMEETEGRLTREIELLALERQRLLLEEEIRDIKLSKAKGWIINAKRRFALGKNKDQEGNQDVHPTDSSGYDQE